MTLSHHIETAVIVVLSVFLAMPAFGNEDSSSGR
jgi:hypothetical protein